MFLFVSYIQCLQQIIYNNGINTFMIYYWCICIYVCYIISHIPTASVPCFVIPLCQNPLFLPSYVLTVSDIFQYCHKHYIFVIPFPILCSTLSDTFRTSHHTCHTWVMKQQ